MDNICVKYHPHLRDHWKVMVWKKVCHVQTFTLAICQGHHTIAWYIIKIQLGSEILWPELGFGDACTVVITSEIWLGSRSWHTLGSWTTIVWNIIQIQLGSEKLWPGHRFPVCVHCDLGDMTLGQGHDTPLGHGQQLCAIISRLDKGVRSYGPDMMWTDGQTDRRTDRQGDSYIPPNFVCGGYKKNISFI